MSSNRLRMNADKTQFVWLGTRQQLVQIRCHTIDFQTAAITVEYEATVKHMKSVVRWCFYYMRQLRTVRKTRISLDPVKTLVQALVASRLDYCNSILYPISVVQSVFNAAARLVMRWPHYTITANLRNDLHWLPIWQRVSFKQFTMVYKCLHMTAPVYLAEMCVPVAASTGRQCLHSASYGNLTVPRTRTPNYGPLVRPFGTVYRWLFASRQHWDTFNNNWRRSFSARPIRNMTVCALSWLLRPFE